MAQTYPTQMRTAGMVHYTLTQKPVRNINLRLTDRGEALVSAAPSVPVADVDAFVAEHADWVFQNRTRLAMRPKPEPPTRAEALALFQEESDRVFPLFEQVLGGQKPQILVREMRARWGSCCPGRRQITFALGLAAVPHTLVEYVVLHEYCHFVHPNHQKEFWALMQQYMPDAKIRRKALHQYRCSTR